MAWQAYVGADIYTGTGEVVAGGTLVVQDGRVAAVGKHVDIPSGAVVIDLGGKTVVPGFVEAHSHAAVFSMSDASLESDMKGGRGEKSRQGPATPDFDFFYNFNPYHEHLQQALEGGVTTLMVRPGSGKVIGGLELVTKAAGRSREDMILKYPAGIKMAFGENPKRAFGVSRRQSPSTRMGVAATLRERLNDARNYMARQAAYERKLAEWEAGSRDPAQRPEPPAADLALEPLVKLLRGELWAHIHVHRDDDIMTILRIGDEFGFRYTLEHATSSFRVLAEIAARQVPCVVGPALVTRDKIECLDQGFATPGLLEKAGVKIAITTDHPVVPIDLLRLSASLAHREGLSAAGTLRAITLGAAEILGVADRVGSLEEGKDADFQVYDGWPFELRSRLLQVYVGGELVYDIATHKEEWELHYPRLQARFG